MPSTGLAGILGRGCGVCQGFPASAGRMGRCIFIHPSLSHFAFALRFHTSRWENIGSGDLKLHHFPNAQETAQQAQGHSREHNQQELRRGEKLKRPGPQTAL